MIHPAANVRPGRPRSPETSPFPSLPLNGSTFHLLRLQLWRFTRVLAQHASRALQPPQVSIHPVRALGRHGDHRHPGLAELWAGS